MSSPLPTTGLPSRKIGGCMQLALGGTVLRPAYCYMITLADETEFCFTTHDEIISIMCRDFEPLSAIHSSNIRNEVGGQPDNTDVLGTLSSDQITEDDLRSGRYDNANVKIILCDWSNVSLGWVTLFRGNIGDISIDDNTYTAGVRSLRQRLRQNIGEVMGPSCRVFKLGDLRCKVNVVSGVTADNGEAIRLGARAIASIDDIVTFHLSGINTRPGFYNYGTMQSVDGQNTGFIREIKLHSDLDTADSSVLTPSPPTATHLSYKDPFNYTPSETFVFSIPAGKWDSAVLDLTSVWSWINVLITGTDSIAMQAPTGSGNDIIIKSASATGTYEDSFTLGNTFITAINAAAGSTFSIALRHTAPSTGGAPFSYIDINAFTLTLIGSADGTTDRVIIHEPFPFDVQIGDHFDMITGCDRLPTTCHQKFDNIINFRGEPSMPGIDKLLQIGRTG